MTDDLDRDGRLPRNRGEETEDRGEAQAVSAEQERIRSLEAELQAKSEEAAKNFDLYVRERAEIDNFRKRLQRDKAEAIRFANEALVRDVLPLLDNLELAVEHAELGGNGKSVVEGVQMILRMFREALERHGVKPIVVPPGTAFDPSVHEASGVEIDPGAAANTVIRQDAKGYQLHDRLLRPARVVVAAATGEAGEKTGE